MSNVEALYVVPPASVAGVELALADVEKTFDGIPTHPRREDRELQGMAVVLQPGSDATTHDRDAVLAIGRVGEIEDPNRAELFLLKAVSRALAQRARGQLTDIQPMERLPWLERDKIYLAASASHSGLHVGFAGGWPHHSRLLAAQFATSMAESLQLPESPEATHEYTDDEAARETLAWLDEGQNAGDGLLDSLNQPQWDRARFALDLIAR